MNIVRIAAVSTADRHALQHTSTTTHDRTDQMKKTTNELIVAIVAIRLAIERCVRFSCNEVQEVELKSPFILIGELELFIVMLVYVSYTCLLVHCSLYCTSTICGSEIPYSLKSWDFMRLLASIHTSRGYTEPSRLSSICYDWANPAIVFKQMYRYCTRFYTVSLSRQTATSFSQERSKLSIRVCSSKDPFNNISTPTLLRIVLCFEISARSDVREVEAKWVSYCTHCLLFTIKIIL